MRKQRGLATNLDLQVTIPVTITAKELQQGLVNLSSNAAHALPERGGVVDLTTSN